jgi:glycine/D-amino acid oxidase-like deaminating enzyme
MTIFRSLNTECHLVTPEEINDLCPLLKVNDLYGGIWIPGDGVGDPYQICLTLMEEAIKRGFYS